MSQYLVQRKNLSVTSNDHPFEYGQATYLLYNILYTSRKGRIFNLEEGPEVPKLTTV